MRISTWSLCLFATVFWAVGASAQAPADRPGPAASKLIVLRNGNILQGEVDQLGDAYRIVTATSEIRLPAREVEQVVDRLSDAYENRRAEVRAGAVDDHLRLATWCIRHEMWPQAARELNDVRALDARHPQLPLLETRLQVAARAAVRASQPQPPTEPVFDPHADENRKRELAELESLAAALPPGTLVEFTRHVQPILVNGCAVAGCHSATDPRAFQLDREVLRGVGNRETTLRNLASVWRQINLQHPTYSPLLTQPAVPHGGLPRPVFSGQREKLHARLSEWVVAATAASRPPQDNPIELAGHEQQAGQDIPATVSPAAADGDAGDLHFWEFQEDGQPRQPPIQRGIAPQQFNPRDEFDPEIFNRQPKMFDGVSSIESTSAWADRERSTRFMTRLMS